MALVSDIQLQPSAVKPPNLDTSQKFSAEGLTATTAFAVTDAGAGNTVGTCGLITARSSNDVRSWLQSTKADGNVELYMTNDARPDWALRVSGTADNAFIIANSYGSNCTAQFPAFSIGGAGAVGIGKTGATNALDIAYKNSTTGGIQITETQNNVGVKVIAESAAGFVGTSSNHKLGFRVNNSTVGLFNTSGQFGIGTDSPGATLDVRGGAVFNEAGAAVDFRIEGDTNQNLFFADGSADAIGIGTNGPVAPLHVIGSDGDPSASHNTGDAMLIVENCGTTMIEIATGNANHAAFSFSDAESNGATRGAVFYDHGTGLGGSADTMMFQTAGGIKAVIDSNGEVGIGTLSPGAALHLAGVDDPEIRIQGAADGDPKINFYQGASTCRATVTYQDSNDVFAIDSAGTLQLQTASTTKLTIGNCVGIGTTAPVDACNAQLDIFSAAATTAIMLRTGNTSAASATIRGEGYRNDGDNEQVLQLVGRNSKSSVDLGIFEVASEAKHCTGALEFKTFDGSSMTQKMIITSAGCVGVGTAAPNAMLQVDGSAIFNDNGGDNDFRVEGDTEQNLFFIDASSDRVGIGTSVPAYRLESLCSSQSTSYPLALRNPDNSTCLSGVGILGGLGRTADSAIQYYAMMTLVKEQTWTGTASTIKGSLLFSTPCNESGVERMRITSAGHVGIGTSVICDNGVGSKVLGIHGTTGHGTLHLTTTSSGTTNADGFILSQCATDAFIINRESGNMYLRTADTNRLTIDSSGDVGIGTTAPNALTSTGTTLTLYESDNTNPANLEFVGGNANGEIAGKIKANYTGNANHSSEIRFSLGPNGADNGETIFLTRGADGLVERMRIGQGCIGIGTTAPDNKLHIHDTTNDNGINMLQLFHDRGASNVCQLDLHYIKFMQRTNNSSGTVQARIAQVLESQVHSSRASGLAFYTENAGTVTEKLRINNSGCVGIGTTTPVAAFHVNNGASITNLPSNTRAVFSNGSGADAITRVGIYAGGASAFSVLDLGRNDANCRASFTYNASADSLTIGTAASPSAAMIGSTGFIGIGTTSNSGFGGSCQQVIINGAANARLEFGIGGSQLGGLFSTADYLALYTSGNDYLSFQTCGTERVRILSDGKVGIGTAAPNATLQVDGSAIFNDGGGNNDFRIEGDTVQNLFIVDASTDRVGIGTSVPASEFEISSADGRTTFTIDERTAFADNEVRAMISFEGILDTDARGQYAFINAISTAGSYGAGELALGIRKTSDGGITELIRLADSGFVGIATTAPCCTLHVYTDGAIIGKGQNVNASAKLDLMSSTNTGVGGVLQGTTNNGVDWQVGHYKGVLSSGTDTALKLQGFNGVSIGACCIGANSSENMYFNANGRIAVGTRDRGNVFFENGHSAMLLVEGTTVGNSSIGLLRNNTQYGPNLILARSCGSSIGSNVLVAANQTIGGISWQANDGTDFVQAATIGAKIGNHAAANCMSGELQFYTTDGTNGSLQERVRISEAGHVGIGCTGPTKRLELNDDSTGSSFDFFNTSTSQADTVFRLNAHRTANSAYSFFKMYSGSGFSDTEFNFRGDGNAYADGSFNNSGADYQEYFESTSGVAAEVGRTIVLDGDKVRYYNAATDSTDDIMGVTRPEADNKNSAVIGNVAWNHWTDKYLTDDWGVYLREDVTVWEWDEVRYVDGDEIPEDKKIDDIKVEAGSSYERDELAKNPSWTPPEGAVSSTQSVRKINPDYNESLIEGYQSRQDRDEWWLIGMLGQIQIKAGEPVNSRWIKMKTISSAVDLYLVR